MEERRLPGPVEAILLETAVAADVDYDLVQRHRRGDPRAFEDLYHRFSAMIFNLALRLCGSPEDAADVTQEVFLRVYRHLDGFRARSSVKTWIYQIGLNQCRSRYARRPPPARPLAEDGAEGVAPLRDPAPGPEALAQASETAARVRAALAGMDESFREAVVLRDLEGLEYAEIAAVLGVRLGTVRSRIARGRERLRQALEGA